MESQRKDNGAKGKQRKRKKDEHRSDAQAVHGQDIGGESDAKRGADKKKKGKEGKEVTSSTPPTLPKAQKESEEARDESKSTEENSDDPIVIAFVNGRSGGQMGAKVKKKLVKQLGEEHVFDLGDGGPKPGLLQFEKEKQRLRVIACGGDGTVSWLLSVLDTLKWDVWPAVAVLPLGTGNDMARTLLWGAGYGGEDLSPFIRNVRSASPLLMDRWFIHCQPIGKDECEAYVENHELNLLDEYGEEDKSPMTRTKRSMQKEREKEEKKMEKMEKKSQSRASDSGNRNTLGTQKKTTRKNSFRDLFKGKDKEKIREKARAAEAEKDANATETQGSDQAKDSHHAAETKENEEKKPKEDNTSVVAPSITIDVSEDEEEEEKMIAQSSESSDAMSGGTQGVDDSVLFNHGKIVARVLEKIRKLDPEEEEVDQTKSKTRLRRRNRRLAESLTSSLGVFRLEVEKSLVELEERADQSDLKNTRAAFEALKEQCKVTEHLATRSSADRRGQLSIAVDDCKQILQDVIDLVSLLQHQSESATTSTSTSTSPSTGAKSDSDTGSAPNAESPREASGDEDPQPPIPVLTDEEKVEESSFMMTNYFSIGIDARAINSFHELRERKPGYFKHRFINYGWYGVLGLKEMARGVSSLDKVTCLVVDGKPVKVKKGMVGLVILNLQSYSGGLDLWGPSTKVGAQSVNDRKFEICGFMSSFHLGRVQGGMANALHVCQGSVVEIMLTSPTYAQCDGEPWQLPRSRITISHENQPTMLLNSAKDKKSKHRKKLEGGSTATAAST